ncbi:hypothetical protein [Micromonospora echinofusca]|uniref:Uncharacterized protein n=1 Tax=Micromonospora echinofusca TaxID=47858 RepID=A0ABS3VPC8_MICEH|nr:hypothetical protein [Micromonospora echinofusca]MBO4206387.1 hypothetical protein [Micromonospora echinofusca]
MEEPATVAALLRPLLGRRLLAVTEARSCPDGGPLAGIEGLVHFWLHFEGSPPVMAHGCGERLDLEFEAPYPSYDMQEYGSTVVGPVDPADLLGSVIGQHLVDVGLLQGYVEWPAVGGVLLRFEGSDLVIASLADEWFLTREPIPERVQPYLRFKGWLSGADTAVGSQ